jgi:hypothetical protein
MNGMTRGLARLIGANRMRASQKLRAPALLRACALTSSLSCVTMAVYHVEAQPSTSKPRAKTSLTHPAVVSQQGVWVQDMSASESLSPFLRVRTSDLRCAPENPHAHDERGRFLRCRGSVFLGSSVRSSIRSRPLCVSNWLRAARFRSSTRYPAMQWTPGSLVNTARARRCPW